MNNDAKVGLKKVKKRGLLIPLNEKQYSEPRFEA